MDNQRLNYCVEYWRRLPGGGQKLVNEGEGADFAIVQFDARCEVRKLSFELPFAREAMASFLKVLRFAYAAGRQDQRNAMRRALGLKSDPHLWDGPW